MQRTPALLAVGVLTAFGALVPVSGASGAPGDVSASLTIIDASTYDYPGVPNPITVCLDGSAVSSDLTAGEEIGPIEISSSSATVDVFDAPQADCSGTPSYTASPAFADGDELGLVLTYRESFTFPYETACPSDGAAWIMGAQAADMGDGGPAVDVYFKPTDSTYDDDLFPVFDGMGYLTSSQLELPTGTYDFLFFPADANPITSTPLGEVTDVAMAPETSTQIFLAGTGEFPGESGAFASQRATEPCDVDLTTSTTTAPSTTTTELVGSGTATPATPVSGTATYTG